MLFADAELARRLERLNVATTRSHATVQQQLFRETGAAVLAVGGGRAVFAGAGSPLNGAVGLGMNRVVTATDLDAVETFYRDRGAPVKVALTPFSDSTLSQLLGDRGYRLVQYLHVHVRPLAATGTAVPPVPGVSVEAVTADNFDVWALTVERGFSGLDDAGPGPISPVTAHRPEVTPFLARVAGEPAGAGALAVSDEVGCLFSASTRVQFRRRGVQAALLHARLQAAAAAGCDLATVTTTPGSASHRNVQRAGFVVAYTRVYMLREWA